MTRQQLLNASDKDVLEEVYKIKYLYNAKKVIRYNGRRTYDHKHESVGEHIYSLMLLAEYFLPLEDPSHFMNWNLVRRILLFHDVAEIETGDIISIKKDAADEVNERKAISTVIRKSPKSFKMKISDSVLNIKNKDCGTEYFFAHILDKLDPIFEMFDDEGKKFLAEHTITSTQYMHLHHMFTDDFPIIKRFFDVITKEYHKNNFFYEQNTKTN